MNTNSPSVTDRRPSPFASAVSHHSSSVIVLAVAVLFAGELLFSRFWATFSCTLASSIIVYVVLAATRRHLSGSCERCAREQENGADGAVTRSWALRLYHRDWLITLGMGIVVAGLFATLIFAMIKNDDFGFWLLKAPSAIVFILIGLHTYAGITHRTFNRWCPVCHPRDEDGDDEPVTPSPQPRITAGA